MLTRNVLKNVKEVVLKNAIENVASKNIFRLKLLDNDYATLEYSEAENGRDFDLIHTIVPDKYQGHGVGKIFAQKTFDYIVQNRWRMKLTCEFLKQFFEQHKDKYEQYVIEGSITKESEKVLPHVKPQVPIKKR